MRKKRTYPILFALFFLSIFNIQSTKAENLLFDEIDLYFDSPNYSDRVRVRLNEIASNDYELGLDALKFMGSNTSVPQAYSRMLIGSAVYTLSVNSLPRNANGLTNVQLGFRYGEQGTYTIRINLPEKAANCTQIILVDSLSPTSIFTTDLKTTSSYTFTSAATVGSTTNTRFKLRLYSAIPYMAIAATSPIISCKYPSVTLTANATAGCTYLWSTGAITPSISVSSPGDYSVTATHTATGRVVSDTKTITLDNTNPTVSISPTPVTELTCNTTSIKLAGNSTNVSYLWSTSGTNSYIYVTQPGDYKLTVTDLTNGCTSNATQTITQNITPPSVEITAPTTELTCTTTSIDLNASTSNVSYLWSTDESVPIINVSTIGDYTVMVTDLTNGCTSSASKTITQDIIQPTVEISVTTTEINCTNTKLDLSAVASNVSYLWSTNETTDKINVTDKGDYTLTVKDLKNGCSNVAAEKITRNTTIPAVEITASSEQVDCNYPTVELNALASNVSYLWSTEEVTDFITVNKSGEYSLIVKDINNGCVNTARKTIGENTVVPEATIGSTADELTCNTTQIDLSVETRVVNPSFIWSTDEQTQQISINNGGDYSVLLTDTDNGCSTSISKQITENTVTPDLQINASALELNSVTTSITLSAVVSEPVSYLWTNQSPASSIEIDAPAVYGVTVIADANGCSSSAEVTIKKDNPVYVVNNKDSSPISIHLTDGQFYFEGIAGVAQISIYDAAGKRVYFNNELHSNEYINKFENGVYLIKIQDKINILQEKVFLIKK